MSEPRCEWSDLPVSMCAHCRTPEDNQPSEPTQRFTARYPGRCANCDDPIEPGDEIAATDDGYLCERCGR